MSESQSDLTTFDVDAAPEGACARYKICGNVVPGRGQMCGECLDELRADDREQREGR
ncbi:hypothetical protein [Halococcus thailandensis]|uniref:hypothetical protein n=1 Tax=Halococcus thailandensis TaxID=335952 RepID=UPI00137566E3|nr:hypothetical protein [Halococcus thailandensis]